VGVDDLLLEMILWETVSSNQTAIAEDDTSLGEASPKQSSSQLTGGDRATGRTRPVEAAEGFGSSKAVDGSTAPKPSNKPENGDILP
jgi:hypothetical protein